MCGSVHLNIYTFIFFPSFILVFLWCKLDFNTKNAEVDSVDFFPTPEYFLLEKPSHGALSSLFMHSPSSSFFPLNPHTNLNEAALFAVVKQRVFFLGTVVLT